MDLGGLKTRAWQGSVTLLGVPGTNVFLAGLLRDLFQLSEAPVFLSSQSLPTVASL